MLKKTQHPADVQQLSNEMIINDNNVSLIAQPKSMFKIIRIINQWITNLVVNYEDQDEINIDDDWYRKWKALYPIIRSSKRSVVEVYRFVTEDLLVENATVLDVLNHFNDIIPKLTQYQTLTPITPPDLDPNHMKYSLTLYYTPYKDTSNRFASVASSTNDKNYRPFTDNRSIMTWNTSASIESVPSISIPAVVTTTNEQDNDRQEVLQSLKETKKLPSMSPDSGISYSETKLSPQALNPTSNERKQKLNKKSEDLKTIIATSCKEEIGKEMKDVKNDIDTKMEDLKISMETTVNENQTKLQELISQALHQPSVHHHRPNTTIPSTYKTNQPSPRAKSRPSVVASTTFTDTNTMNNPSKMDANDNSMQRAFQKSGTMVFHYEDNVYELRDGDFNKLKTKFTAVATKSDLIILYKQLHGMAITHNIFLTPFDQLVPWNKDPNSITPTCLFTTIMPETNTVDAYRRMKSALYHKLTQATFTNQEYQAIVDHGKTDQDGFDILYDLMTLCHPKLVAVTNKYRSINEKPEFDKTDSIYSFCDKIQSWLDIELINNHIHTEDDIINMVLEQLRADTRFDKAVESITQQLTFNDTFQRQLGTVVFPEGLKLRNLPGTIMSYYSTEEKADLFPTDASNSTVNQLNDTNVVEAIINSMSGRPSYARESVDKFCPGCGQLGHDVFQSGCDFCAKQLLVTEFFKKFNNMKPKVIEKYKAHQSKIRAAKQEKSKNNSSSPRKQRFPKKKYKATVRLLQDIMDSIDENDSESEEFEDANEEENEEDQSVTSNQDE
jgi:hypothetical protein